MLSSTAFLRKGERGGSGIGIGIGSGSGIGIGIEGKELYPRAESNRNRWNRNPKFYPLNYGGETDCKYSSYYVKMQSRLNMSHSPGMKHGACFDACVGLICRFRRRHGAR